MLGGWERARGCTPGRRVGPEGLVSGLRSDCEAADDVAKPRALGLGAEADAGEEATGETGLEAPSPPSDRLPNRFLSEPMKDLRTPSRSLLLLLLSGMLRCGGGV